MALRIADYYASYPDADAIAGVGSHFARFWTPAMRADLAAAWSSWRSAEPVAASARNAQLITATLATSREEPAT